MEKERKDVWENCWNGTDAAPLGPLLERYYKKESAEIELFRQHGIKTICDAACGFGAYSVAFASQGFRVDSFDISETAVRLTRAALERYGLDSSRVKTADLLRTGYPDQAFDGVAAHSVLDHMTVPDAQKALRELLRITRPGGLLLVSFDMPEDGAPDEPHLRLEDGSILYTGAGRHQGMIFHPYDWNEIEDLLHGQEILYRAVNEKGEQVAAFQKRR